jgi:peptide-methionine (S)-S-oxide reductase
MPYAAGMGAYQSHRITRAQALPGRSMALPRPERHHVTGKPLLPEPAAGILQAQFAMGCFWGAERLFWRQPGVVNTAVGYAGGYTPNPSYEEVCSGLTDHTEVVLVWFDTGVVKYEDLLAVFWSNHDPTQGLRQGGDVGSQYRSALYCTTDAQLESAGRSRDAFQQRLKSAGLGPITTEIAPAPPFYFAEGYHQQYLAKNPGGYCGLRGVGVTYCAPEPPAESPAVAPVVAPAVG